MQMNLQQGLTPSVIHAPIVSIGACPVMIVSIKPVSTFAGEDQETIGA